MNELYAQVQRAVSALTPGGHARFRTCNICNETYAKCFVSDGKCIACDNSANHQEMYGFEECFGCGRTFFKTELKHISYDFCKPVCEECAEKNVFRVASENCLGFCEEDDFPHPDYKKSFQLYHSIIKSQKIGDIYVTENGKFYSVNRDFIVHIPRTTQDGDWFFCTECGFVKRSELKTSAIKKSVYVHRVFSTSHISPRTHLQYGVGDVYEDEVESCCTLCKQRIDAQNEVIEPLINEVNLQNWKCECSLDRIKKFELKHKRKEKLSHKKSSEMFFQSIKMVESISEKIGA